MIDLYPATAEARKATIKQLVKDGCHPEVAKLLLQVVAELKHKEGKVFESVASSGIRRVASRADEPRGDAE